MRKLAEIQNSLQEVLQQYRTLTLIHHYLRRALNRSRQTGHQRQHCHPTLKHPLNWRVSFLLRLSKQGGQQPEGKNSSKMQYERSLSKSWIQSKAYNRSSIVGWPPVASIARLSTEFCHPDRPPKPRLLPGFRSPNVGLFPIFCAHRTYQTRRMAVANTQVCRTV
jgi:hypothetical protein